jgi:putative ABC transport system permease protein
MLTLALGAGTNAAIFSVVDTVLLRGLPYSDADRLVKIAFETPGVGLHDVPFSFPELDDLRNRAGVFDEVTVVFPASVNVTGAKEPRRLELLGVSPNYFSMLGVQAVVGRLFGPEDEAPGFAQGVVISDGLWRRAYGADPAAVGRTLRLDNDLYTVIGVVDPAFRHPGRTVAQDVDVWAAAGFRADPFPVERRARLLPGAIGRLKVGLSLAEAQARLDSFADQLRSDHPSDYPPESRWTVRVHALRDALVGNVQPLLLVLMAAVVVISVIAAVNLATLQLARASGRQREIAVRLALGAGRHRIARQMLVESLMLAAGAGAVGVAAAAASLQVLLRMVPAAVPRLHEVTFDAGVLAWAVGVSTVSAVISGVAPAMQATAPGLAGAFREGSSGAGYGPRTRRTRGLLVASEFALGVVLLVGAGLLLRTLSGLLREDPGFNPTQVVTASVWLPVPNDPAADQYAAPPARAAFVREMLRRVEAIPGVELAAITSSLPMSGARASAPLAVEGRDTPAQPLTADVIAVTPGYFRALQISLVRGRLLGEEDDARGRPAALVDETTARLHWDGQDAVGRRLRLGPPNAPWLTVVGVVKDVKHDGLDRDGVPHVYTALYQRPGRSLNAVMRTTLPTAALEPQIRRAIQGADPELPVFGVRTMTEAIDRSLAARRFAAELVGAFALAALLVTAIGVYGLQAYLVGQRRREFGLRMALGARRADIMRLALGGGLRFVAIGIATGMAAAATGAPALRAMLYGVGPLDPGVFVAVPLLLLTVALVASVVPSWRATEADPMSAFREE